MTEKPTFTDNRKARFRLGNNCRGFVHIIDTLLLDYPDAFMPGGEVMHIKRVRDGLNALAERIEQNDNMHAASARARA